MGSQRVRHTERLNNIPKAPQPLSLPALLQVKPLLEPYKAPRTGAAKTSLPLLRGRALGPAPEEALGGTGRRDIGVRCVLELAVLKPPLGGPKPHSHGERSRRGVRAGLALQLLSLLLQQPGEGREQWEAGWAKGDTGVGRGIAGLRPAQASVHSPSVLTAVSTGDPGGAHHHPLPPNNPASGGPGCFLTQSLSPFLLSPAGHPLHLLPGAQGWLQDEEAALTGDKAGRPPPLGCPPAARSEAWSRAG